MSRERAISWELLALAMAASALSACSGAMRTSDKPLPHSDWTDYYFAHEWRTIRASDDGATTGL
jgi:hypothetical protein